MSLSSALLVLAVLGAAVPVVAIGPRPPTSIRNLEKGFVTSIVTLGIGTFVISRTHRLDLFAVIHLLYLLAVVTIPVILASWWALAFIRRRRSRLTRLYGAGAVVIALFGVWGTHIEPNWLDVDRAVLAADVQVPFRIGVLSDMQTPNIGQHEQNAVTSILETDPDLVVVPGDLFQGNAATIAANAPDFVALLKQLVAEVEIVAIVSGDSDRADALERIAVDAGALFIDNSIRDVIINGQAVRLAGVQVAQTSAQLTTIADLGTPSDAFTLLVSHRPDIVYALPPGTDVDLIVAGHTHGGQVSLPFFGPPVTFSDIPRDLAAGGLGVVDNFVVYVSAGVGLERHAAPQVRFGVRPEVGIIDVVPG